MHNWDLVNPNAQTAHRFRLTFLSPQADAGDVVDLRRHRAARGARPTLSANGTQTFKGTTYNRFRLTWSTDKAWNGAAARRGARRRRVPRRRDVLGHRLQHAGPDHHHQERAARLGRHPLRAPAAAARLRRGGGRQRRRRVRDSTSSPSGAVRHRHPRTSSVRELPRVLSIDAMVPRREALSTRSASHSSRYERHAQGRLRRSRTLKRGATLRVPVASMADERHLLDVVDADDCDVGDSAGRPATARRASRAGTSGCSRRRRSTSPRRVVQPDARCGTGGASATCARDLESRIFYQLGGIHPDLNKNRDRRRGRHRARTARRTTTRTASRTRRSAGAAAYLPRAHHRVSRHGRPRRPARSRSPSSPTSSALGRLADWDARTMMPPAAAPARAHVSWRRSSGSRTSAATGEEIGGWLEELEAATTG